MNNSGLDKPQANDEILKSLLEEHADLERQMQQRQIHNLIECEYKYKISYNQKQGLYYTRKLDGNSKLRASTREGLEQKIYELYFSTENKTTIDNLFWKYLEDKKKSVTDETIRRERDVYRKHIANTDFSETDIKKVKASDIKTFLWNFSGKLKNKELTSIKSCINGVYDYAIEHDIVTENLARAVRMNKIKKIATVTYDNVYSETDRTRILETLENSTNIYDQAIKLLFYMGLRSGEVRALKWSDIGQTENGDYFIIVRREMVTRNNKDIPVEHTKTGDDSGVREIFLHEKVLKILEEIPHKNGVEFIFTGRNDNPIYQQPLRERMEQACKDANVKYRGIHKIRACMTTMLINHGASMNTVKNFGGWKDTQTVMGYFRNVQSKAEMRDAIVRAF